ncbi:MAG: hypothetical protein HY393_03860 [Candidatus Diapherotrites archaeon]|nr:hypothetical protein [Candidatus Diapherotrites archaeon]
MKPRLNEWVTFTPNKGLPIHNWFYYKEGFSAPLVEWAVKGFKLEGPILDPFCGVGTTLLSCKLLGLEAYGFDVSPLAVFVSRAKTRNYNVELLREEFSRVQSFEPAWEKPFPKELWFASRFNRSVLREILAFKEFFVNAFSSPVSGFFLLALIDSALRVSNVERQGASLRAVKKSAQALKPILLEKIERMMGDVRRVPQTGAEPFVEEGDARWLKALSGESVGSIVTSPPYLNKVEYASAYKLELALFFRAPTTQLRSFLGSEGVRMSSQVPIIDAYFEDMARVLKEMNRVLIPGGKAVIVVGGGCFPDRAVESDDRLVELGLNAGFELVKLLKAREIPCGAHGGLKGRTVRESIIVLKKQV